MKCQQEGLWVEETPYEVLGIMVREHSVMTEAPRKARESAMLQVPKLFDGLEFFFASDFTPPQPSKEDLVKLVKMAGGTVLNRPPRSSVTTHDLCPYHAKPGSHLSTRHVVIVSSSNTQPVSCATFQVHVPPTWIFDCLSHFELVDTDIR
jgi:hypothetical protein